MSREVRDAEGRGSKAHGSDVEEPLNSEMPEAPAAPAPDAAGARSKRRLSGAYCAPPPPPPPDYLRRQLPAYPERPPGWICRRCVEWWNWHPYRPPTEKELDEPCAKCGKALDFEERKVEVLRLLLARAGAGGTWDVPVPSVHPLPVPGAAQDEESSSGVACTVDEAGRRLGCKRTVVFKLLRQGRLVAAPKLGRKRLVLVSSVDALLEAGGVSSVVEPKKPRRPRGPRTGNGKALAAEIAKLPV